MRKILGAAFVSLDGVMQAPGGTQEDTRDGFDHGGWWVPQHDEQSDGMIGSWFEKPFALLLGRRTYDIFAAYWPFMPSDNPIAEAFNRTDKYVLTNSDAPLEWGGSHRLANLDAVAALKNGDGPDLLIQGSSTLYPQLLARGLIDRLTLMIGPLLLGSGKRLFGDGTPPRALRLVEHAVTAKGVVIASYEPAGQVQTGSFGADEPSDRELERRRKIAAGTW
ncbi:MAG: dihydrofolate reductase [Novosphingobium sp.]|nr:dihydrofolate reductase [Novosphingobium sp.]